LHLRTYGLDDFGFGPRQISTGHDPSSFVVICREGHVGRRAAGLMGCSLWPALRKFNHDYTWALPPPVSSGHGEARRMGEPAKPSFNPIRYQPRSHVGIAPSHPRAAPPSSYRGSIGNGVEDPCISYEEIDLRQEFTPRSSKL